MLGEIIVLQIDVSDDDSWVVRYEYDDSSSSQLEHLSKGRAVTIAHFIRDYIDRNYVVKLPEIVIL